MEDKIKGLQERLNHASEVERRVAYEELASLDDTPPGILNTAKQRNGDWEGKCGIWFNQQTYQYRSSQDDRLGIKYVAMPANHIGAL
jgi:twinkle protein